MTNKENIQELVDNLAQSLSNTGLTNINVADHLAYMLQKTRGINVVEQQYGFINAMGNAGKKAAEELINRARELNWIDDLNNIIPDPDSTPVKDIEDDEHFDGSSVSSSDNHSDKAIVSCSEFSMEVSCCNGGITLSFASKTGSPRTYDWANADGLVLTPEEALSLLVVLTNKAGYLVSMDGNEKGICKSTDDNINRRLEATRKSDGNINIEFNYWGDGVSNKKYEVSISIRDRMNLAAYISAKVGTIKPYDSMQFQDLIALAEMTYCDTIRFRKAQEK